MEEELYNLISPLSHVLGLDIEIVTPQSVRIASTGIYKERVGKQSAEMLYHKSTQTGEMVIVENPRNSAECRGCTNVTRCTKKIMMVFPMIVNKQVVGNIGIFTFNENIREKVLQDIENYILVFKNLTDNIGVRFYKTDYFEIYKELFFQMKRGVIILNEKGIILDYNRTAHINFKNIKDLIGKKITITSLEAAKYELSIANQKIIIEGSIHISKNGKNYIIFNNTETSHQRKLIDGLLLGKSKVITDLKLKIEKVINKNIPLLINGDMGTNKDMLAKWIHNSSNRSEQKYISINCRDEDETQIEEKLFGNDVDENLQVGIFESANNGTVFIAEIDYLPFHIQKKILKFLETGKITPLNGNKELNLDVRLIISTQTNLLEKVKKGEFLENLYYKINAVNIEIPSLKYRKDDLEEIIEYLIQKYSKILEKEIKGIDPKAKKYLYDYEWTGNWKEIESTMEVIIEFVAKDGIITEQCIPERIKNSKKNYDNNYRKIKKLSELEREEIVAALSQYGYETEGKKKIAMKLGIGIATLYRKIEIYQIDKKK